MSKNRDERQERGKIQWQFAGAKMHELENEDLAGPRRNPLHERTKGLLSHKRAGTRSRPAREHDQNLTKNKSGLKTLTTKIAATWRTDWRKTESKTSGSSRSATPNKKRKK
jgi:hypothetical protein